MCVCICVLVCAQSPISRVLVFSRSIICWSFPDLIGLCTGLIATQISAASLFMHAGRVGRGWTVKKLWDGRRWKGYNLCLGETNVSATVLIPLAVMGINPSACRLQKGRKKKEEDRNHRSSSPARGPRVNPREEAFIFILHYCPLFAPPPGQTVMRGKK